MQFSNTKVPTYSGTDIDGCLSTLEELSQRRVDVLASAAHIRMGLAGDQPTLYLSEYPEAARDGVNRGAADRVVATCQNDTHEFLPTNDFHDQLAEKLGIPSKYYERMATTAPALLARNANHWLRESSKRHLIRGFKTEDGRIIGRAFLSDRYRVLDHADLAVTALRAALEATSGRDLPPPVCFGWNLSERSFDLLLVSPHICADLLSDDPMPPDVQQSIVETVALGGDPAHEVMKVRSEHDQGGRRLIFAGIRIRNSETGRGGFRVEVVGLDWVCKNRAIRGIEMAQVHLGRALNEELLTSPETRAKENEVIFMKAADAVRGAFDHETWDKLVDTLRQSRKVRILPITEAVDAVARREGLTDAVKNGVLAAYRREVADHDTLFDLQNAITAVARETRNPMDGAADPDRAEDLEMLAARLTDAPPAELLLSAR